MSKAIAALVRLGLEAREARKREFFRKLKANIENDDPKQQERQISHDDLCALAEWKAEDPDVPGAPWYQDFGSFKLCGTGRLPPAERNCNPYGLSASDFVESAPSPAVHAAAASLVSAFV